MISSVFDIDNFNIIQDEDSYYFFRAINYADGLDIERGITFSDNQIKRIRTDRERFEAIKGTAKYSAESEITLEEVYDHVKNRYIKETNCISLSKNANVSLEYGQLHGNGYVLVKVPKKDMGQTYDAGKYMLEEVRKKVYDVIQNLPQDSEMLSVIKEIENAEHSENVSRVIVDFYEKESNQDFISKDAVKARFDKKQHFSEEQQLEYNKVIGLLSVLEIAGELKNILTTQSDNSYLIGAIGSCFSNGELIHYGDIQENEIYSVSSEMVNVLALIQQLKEKNIDSEVLKDLEKKAIEYAVSQNVEVSIKPEGQEIINHRYNTELTIEEVYKLTKGRVSYEKAQIAIEFVRKLSQSKVEVEKYIDIINELSNGNEDIIQILLNECYVIDKDIINRENGKGVKITGSINAGLDKNRTKFVSDYEQIRLVKALIGMTRDELKNIVASNGLDLENEILESILDKKDEITENRYFAEAIVDALNFEKIYRKTNGNREVDEQEREILIEKLEQVNCKNIYHAFSSLGKKHDVIAGYIVNLLINGYRNQTLYELSNDENIYETIKNNIGSLSPVVNALKLDKVLGIEDDAFAISGTGIKLRDYQKDVLQHIDDTLEEKRFVGMVLPTGSGKSFIAMSEMLLKYKNSNIVFIAPQITVLNQFKNHIDKVLGKDYFPYLKMFCYDTIADKYDDLDDKFFESLNADLIIFDEAHRAGAFTYQRGIEKMLKKNPKAKVLAMTATPIRDVDGKDMIKELAKMTGSYTEEEMMQQKYLPDEMDVLDAMQDNIVVSPKVVTFDYTLDDSEEYKEVKRMLDLEQNPDKKAELEKIYKEMTAIIKNSKKEGIAKIIADNIKKKDGRYIIFLPNNDTGLPTEEYIKQQIEIVKGYFKDVDENPSISYLTSDRSKKDNLNAIKEFESSSSDNEGHLKLIFAINMLNEGVHVDGIDGCVMLRPISENSRILYKQQIGRCIFSLDPDNPIADEDRPIIFDVYNNYLAQNMDREANRTTPTSDLQRLQMLVNWINKHKGYIPDINSEDIKEAKKAISLKNIQKKYRKYIAGIENKNLNEIEKYKIEKIIELGKSIDLWNIEIPDRIIPPGEKDISRNDTFKVAGTQREFTDLFKKAKSLTQSKQLTSNLRLRTILNVLDVLAEYGFEINDETLPDYKILKYVLKELPEQDRAVILEEVGVEEDFKIGEEYRFAIKAFLEGKKLFTQYSIDNLRACGIFAGFKEEFIERGPSDFIGMNIFTGTLYNKDGYDKYGYDEEGYNRNGCTEYNFDREGYYWELQEDGTYKKTDRKIDKYNFDREGYYWELREDGTYKKTDRKIDKYNFDRNGYYYELQEDGTYKKTNRKLDDRGFDHDGINQKTNKKTKARKLAPFLDEYNFDRDGYYWEWVVDAKIWRKTDRKVNSNNLSFDGYYWELQEDGSYKKTDRRIGTYNFDIEGYYYEVQEDGTYKKTDRTVDNYNFNAEGYYCKVDYAGKYYSTDKKYDTYHFDRDGYYWYGGVWRTEEKIDNHQFDRDGFYYELQKDGTYKNTGSKLDRHNFDRDGFFWLKDNDGKYVKYNNINLRGFDRDGFLRDREGKPHKYDYEGYNIDGINKYGFNRQGYYCKEDFRGVPKSTGLKYNERGFLADGTHVITKTRLDIRNFDIEGLYFGTLLDKKGKTFDENGFNVNGIHKITEGPYYEGYNAYGVDEKGLDREGKVPYEIQFGKDYVNMIRQGKLPELAQKYPDLDKDKIGVIFYKATEMYPKLKRYVCEIIEMYMEKIKEYDEKLKSLSEEQEQEKEEIESLQKNIGILKRRIARMNPMQGMNK